MADLLKYLNSDWATAGPNAEAELMGPMYQQQGLAGVMAQNLQRQGGEANNMLAGQMQANPQAGLQGMEMLDQRGVRNSEMAKNYGVGAKGQSDASRQDAITSLIQGGYNGQGAGGGPGGLQGLKNAFAIESGDSAKIQANEDRARYPSGWKDSALDTYRKQDAADLDLIGSYDNLVNQYTNYEPTSALSVMKQLSMFVKSFDEGIVRKDDVDQVRAATGSGTDELLAMATQYWKEGTAFPEKMGIRIMDALKDVMREKQANFVQAANRHETFGDAQGWGDAGRRRAIPNRKIAAKMRVGMDNLKKEITVDNKGLSWIQTGEDEWSEINPLTGMWKD
jgi:hypothetical protein